MQNASRLFMNTVKVTNLKLPRHSKDDEEDALFERGEFGDSNPAKSVDLLLTVTTMINLSSHKKSVFLTL